MGEIHYSRVPESFWKEELLKMKAGGVTIVSSYVIWIHHEDIENRYDWSGCRNLHAFVECVKECGLKILLRIGPWTHGETRNGGFPDWLLKKDFKPRTNDERYFETVRKWYTEIYHQVDQFICNPRDDSTRDEPIIGIQIENEFGHCGGLYDETGDEHMKRLLAISKETGFNVSLYTATGWGGARTGGMLPVMGGYCDAPWDRSIEEIEPSGNYVFTHERNDHNIGSDFGFGHGITFDIDKFPYLTAELGGGLQVTAHRRTIATAKDIASVAVVKLGSGVNLLGFYMYTGGTNPDGKLTTLQESTASGDINDLPVKSYDFRAPVREFGQVSDTLRELKLLSYFVKDFGEELCTLDAQIPQPEVKAADTQTLRYAMRTDGKKGYIVINNYVRHRKMAEHKSFNFKAPGTTSPVTIENIKNGEYFFLPFNMTYGKAKIEYGAVTPYFIAAGQGDEEDKRLFVFYAREDDDSAGNPFSFYDGAEYASKHFLVLSRKDALNSWKLSSGQIVITPDDACVYEDNNSIVFEGRKNASFDIYPDFETAPSGWKRTGFINKNTVSVFDKIQFAHYESLTTVPAEGYIAHSDSCETDAEGNSIYKIDLSEFAEKVRQNYPHDCFIQFAYTGDSAELYYFEDGQKKLLLDNFYLGEDYSWEIGLRRFAGSDIDFSNLELKIKPLFKNQKIYLEKWPVTNGEKEAKINSITYQWSYRIPAGGKNVF